jgi:hypothetical protein
VANRVQGQRDPSLGIEAQGRWCRARAQSAARPLRPPETRKTKVAPQDKRREARSCEREKRNGAVPRRTVVCEPGRHCVLRLLDGKSRTVRSVKPACHAHGGGQQGAAQGGSGRESGDGSLSARRRDRVPGDEIERELNVRQRKTLGFSTLNEATAVECSPAFGNPGGLTCDPTLAVMGWGLSVEARLHRKVR